MNSIELRLARLYQGEFGHLCAAYGNRDWRFGAAVLLNSHRRRKSPYDDTFIPERWSDLRRCGVCSALAMIVPSVWAHTDLGGPRFPRSGRADLAGVMAWNLAGMLNPSNRGGADQMGLLVGAASLRRSSAPLGFCLASTARASAVGLFGHWKNIARSFYVFSREMIIAGGLLCLTQGAGMISALLADVAGAWCGDHRTLSLFLPVAHWRAQSLAGQP